MPDRPVLIVGAGGHAKVVIELLRAMSIPIAGLIDQDRTKQALGVACVGADEDLPRLRAEGLDRAFVAIGDNRRRLDLGRGLVAGGFELVNAVSPNAVISPSVALGRGVAVMAGAVINAEARIGDLAIVNTGAVIDHDCVIGEGAHLAPGSTLAGSIDVGEGAFVGVGASVIPGMRIGAFATVGGGACVVRDVAPAATVVGVPARPIRT